ncbi:MAG TPA: tetratricopeptide repeat protein [Reyranella sp.]|jgi:TPR repeat protein|nr:tetratricopeptide repeat protein [Reyranella sp.]
MSGTARADGFADAQRAYVRGDYDGALRILSAAAEANDVNAQYMLGWLRLEGWWSPIRVDASEGIKWLQAAAENNDARAQFRMGDLYRVGQYVPRDEAKAFAWYLRAAMNGDAYSQGRVARAYLYGYGIARDTDQALHWYRKVAEAGLGDAAEQLGYIYTYGYIYANTDKVSVVSPDEGEALRWFLKAAANPHFRDVEPLEYIATFYDKGLGVAKNRSEALRWYERAAQGYAPYAQYQLGVAYELGDGVARDFERAFEFYHRSADKGFRPAHYRLGLAWLRGEQGPVDVILALKSFVLATGRSGDRKELDAEFAAFPDLYPIRYRALDPSAYRQAVKDRDALTATMSRAQITAADDLADAFELEPPPPPQIH